MAAVAILNFTAFRYSDFGRFLVCYSPHETVPETVEKPFLAIFLGLNRIFTGLVPLSAINGLSRLTTTNNEQEQPIRIRIESRSFAGPYLEL